MQRAASLILHVLYEVFLKHKKNTLAIGKGIKAMLPKGRGRTELLGLLTKRLDVNRTNLGFAQFYRRLGELLA